ncbi:MAG: HAD-IA family hydrolase [Saccharofermentanaceae bacterium]|nr:HAD-IA family hydrolase [Saccharofermentanaceae bacterium]
MIKAVIFDMFETLITLFTEHTYFGEDAASDAGVDPVLYRKVWHENEKDRTTGKMTIEEGIGETLQKLGVYSDELLKTIVGKRLFALKETFDQIPDESVQLLEELKKRGIKVGLITNTFSDERNLIRSSKLFPLFDATRISYEEGVLKPDPSMYLSIMEELGVTPEECLYVGDGGSKELFAARDIGMKALQASWFRELAFEPHIPCPVLPEFPQVMRQLDVLDHLS